MKNKTKCSNCGSEINPDKSKCEYCGTVTSLDYKTSKIKTNCPNCGAPIDPSKNKCDYCGTTYLDFTCLDFEDDTPIFMKIKTNIGVGKNKVPVVITQRVIPRLKGMTFENEFCDVMGNGQRLMTMRSSYSLTTGVEFVSCPSENDKVLFTVEEV